jgi:hypothetical protein
MPEAIILGDSMRVLMDKIALRKVEHAQMAKTASRFWKDQRALLVHDQETAKLQTALEALRVAATVR